MPPTKKIILISSLVIIIVIATIVYINAPRKSPVEQLLQDAGAFMQPPPEEYGYTFGKKIIDTLLPKEDVLKLVPSSADYGELGAILWDYRDRGKILSYSESLDLGSGSMFNIRIDRPDGIKLRYKIVIGTDMRNWELIKKETSWPEDDPFKRAYVLVQRRGEKGRMAGLVFFEGMVVQIDIKGNVNDDSIKNLEEVTWLVKDRVPSVYVEYLQGISEGPLFKDNPTLSRPDLPDPDLQ